MKRIFPFLLALFPCFIFAQTPSFTLGTDFPYQHFAGVAFQAGKVDFSIRSGVLLPPYSSVILYGLQEMGTSNAYINLLENAYQFGWMNTVGAHLYFGKENSWYLGPEARLDYLTAAETPLSLVELATGQKIPLYNPFDPSLTRTSLGLILGGSGLRLGRSWKIGNKGRQRLLLEFSGYKYLYVQSKLTSSGISVDGLNQTLSDLLDKKVFKPNGYLAGVGIALKL